MHPTRHTLVRVFLRPGAKMPRTLEKNISHLPHCTTVVSPRGGANAADFVMSLHARGDAARDPAAQHIHFLMVTNDATLQAMAAELQRLGRVASIWTSHPDAEQMSVEARSEETFEEPKAARSRSRGGRSRGGRSSSRRGGSGRSRTSSSSSSRAEPASRAAAEPSPAAPVPAPVADEPRKPGGKTLSEVAWTYAARLQRIKGRPVALEDAPQRRIKNRAGSQGFNPEEVLEELKRHHGVKVDSSGRVTVARAKPAAEGEAADVPESRAVVNRPGRRGARRTPNGRRSYAGRAAAADRDARLRNRADGRGRKRSVRGQRERGGQPDHRG